MDGMEVSDSISQGACYCRLGENFGIHRVLGPSQMGLLALALSMCLGRASSVTLAWDAVTNSSIAGYVLYTGETSRVYSASLDVHNATQTTVSNLSVGSTYFFAVTAYDTNNLESDYSAEVSYTVSAGNANPPVITLTSPGNGTTFVSPTNVLLSASVITNGHSATKVQFVGNGSVLGESMAAPYSLTWSNPTPGNYAISALLFYDGSNTLSSAVANVTVNAAAPPGGGLPAPWQSKDVGRPSIAGSADTTNGLYYVAGAGNINSTADNFQFVYQPLTGDGQVTAQINSVENAGPGNGVGVMIRETLASNSKQVFMGISGSSTFRWRRRALTGGSTGASSFGTGVPPNAWVRLTRSGSTFSGSYSIDGVNWTEATSRSFIMASNIYVGLAVASGSSNVLNHATIQSVNVVP